MTTDATELPRHCAWCEPHTPGATSYICEECEELMGRASDAEDHAELVIEAVLAYAGARVDIERSHNPRDARHDDLTSLYNAKDRAFRRVCWMLNAALDNAAG